MPIPVAAPSKAWVCGRSLAGNVGSNPIGSRDICFFFSVLCSQVEVSATGRSLVQRSSTECRVSKCDLKISTMSPGSTGVFEP